MRTLPTGGGGKSLGPKDYIRRIGKALKFWEHGKEISVCLFHENGDKNGAETLRVYAEYALEEAFGDEYRINVFVADKPLPKNLSTFGGFIDWVQANDVPHADAYHGMYRGGESQGGPPWSVAQYRGELAKLPTDPIDVKGGGEPHRQMNIHIHEIGHALGMGHQGTNAKKDGYTCPMATSYVASSLWIHEYHESSIKDSNY
jgi:hypothetical protein